LFFVLFFNLFFNLFFVDLLFHHLKLFFIGIKNVPQESSQAHDNFYHLANTNQKIQAQQQAAVLLVILNTWELCIRIQQQQHIILIVVDLNVFLIVFTPFS